MSCVEMRAFPSADYSPLHDVSIRSFGKICDFYKVELAELQSLFFLFGYGSRFETNMEDLCLVFKRIANGKE